jgi:Fe-S cluster assembly protein SufB
LATFEKLGISLEEQKRLLNVAGSNVAVDAVFDSVSVKTTFQETLREKGVIFCSFSEAVREHPELIKQYLGSVVPMTDNYYAASIRQCSAMGRSATSPRVCAAQWN